MNLQSTIHEWIESAWREVGKDFGAVDVPVGQFAPFDTDNLRFPFDNAPMHSWRLVQGRLLSSTGESISQIPYIAFCVNESKSATSIQVQWASRCGYGWDLEFGPSGELVKQCMRWVS